MLLTLIQLLLILIPILMSMAFLTLAERNVLASMQIRQGPNIVGIFGILQPFADALNLFANETILPTHANTLIFLLAPIFSLALALISWAVIPFGPGLVLSDNSLGVLYLLAVSSLSVYTILFSGWSSNSSYAFLGSLSSTAQMISYEVSMGLILICVLITAGSLNLTQILINQNDIWYILPLWPAFFMFYVSVLAETSSTPFDLPEGESELVSGYNVEYSSMTFALFFLAEYIHIILMSFMTTLFFLGGWLPPIQIIPLTWIPPIFWLIINWLFVIFAFLWVSATFPSYSYDQLMALLWNSYLPLSLGLVIWVAGGLIGGDYL